MNDVVTDITLSMAILVVLLAVPVRRRLLWWRFRRGLDRRGTNTAGRKDNQP